MKMVIKSDGNFSKAESYFNKLANIDLSKELDPIMNDGLESFISQTPKNTGKAAESWQAYLEKSKSGYDMTYYNTDVDANGMPIVLLLYYGHGTGTGGYVPPFDFITPVLNTLNDSISKSIERSIGNG